LGRDKGGEVKKNGALFACVSAWRTTMMVICRAFLPKAHGKDRFFSFSRGLACGLYKKITQ
jgi:hypothetical protein